MEVFLISRLQDEREAEGPSGFQSRHAAVLPIDLMGNSNMRLEATHLLDEMQLGPRSTISNPEAPEMGQNGDAKLADEVL